jgi:hypothetical protein
MRVASPLLELLGWPRHPEAKGGSVLGQSLKSGSWGLVEVDVQDRHVAEVVSGWLR